MGKFLTASKLQMPWTATRTQILYAPLQNTTKNVFATQNRQVHIIYHCFRLAEARKDDKKEKLARPISLWCLI